MTSVAQPPPSRLKRAELTVIQVPESDPPGLPRIDQ